MPVSNGMERMLSEFLMLFWIWAEPFMTLPAYMPTGFLLKSAAVNVYLDSGFAKAGNVMTLFLSPKADIRI